MASINDAVTIRKLLERRKEVVHKLKTLQDNRLSEATLSFPKKDNKKFSRSEIEEHYHRITSFVVWGGGDAAKEEGKALTFKDEPHGIIQGFFIRLMYDYLGGIDLELHELGFEFPEGYHKDMHELGEGPLEKADYESLVAEPRYVKEDETGGATKTNELRAKKCAATVTNEYQSWSEFNDTMIFQAVAEAVFNMLEAEDAEDVLKGSVKIP